MHHPISGSRDQKSVQPEAPPQPEPGIREEGPQDPRAARAPHFGGRALPTAPLRAPPQGAPKSLTTTREGRRALRCLEGTGGRRVPHGALPASRAAAPAARRGCSSREGGDGGGHKPGASPTSKRAPRPQRGPAPGGAPLLLSLCPRLSAWPWRPRSRPTPRPPATPNPERLCPEKAPAHRGAEVTRAPGDLPEQDQGGEGALS